MEEGMPGPGVERSPLRALDYVFILRPTVLVGMWVFYFWGAVLASRAPGAEYPLLAYSPRLLAGFLSMSAALGGGCLLNQMVDVETDRTNEKLFFLPRGIISMRAARVELVVVWAAAALLALPLGLHFTLVLCASLVLNHTYSAPPVRAKARFPLDMLWNGLGFGLVSTAAGWAAVAPLRWWVLFPGLVYALAVAGVTASTTLPDVEGDRAAGLRTAAVVLGEKRASQVTMQLIALAAVAGWFLLDPLAIYGSVLSLPALLLAHNTEERQHRLAANQIMVAVFLLVASYRAPYLLGLLALVYFGSRAYYRARFDIAYPGPGTP
jgi:4-hydroxybenzoate polyprenyltransferase